MCLDLATRRISSPLQDARSSSVGLLTRKAILQWAHQKGIKTDNVSDFVAKDTDRQVPRSCRRPALEKYSRRKGSSRAGHQDFSTAPARSAGFIGHDVADRKAIESRKSFADRLGCDDADAFAVQLTAAELQRYIDEWVEYSYSPTEHTRPGRPHTPERRTPRSARCAASTNAFSTCC